jgi:hypothetical protein
MATIDDGRAQLLAGQAERLRNDAAKACELLRRGDVAGAADILERNSLYAKAIWHELWLVTQSRNR